MHLRFGSLIGVIVGVSLAAVPAGATSVIWAGASSGPVVSGWLGDVSSYSLLDFSTIQTMCPADTGCPGGSVALGSTTISGAGLQVNYDGDYGSPGVAGFEAPSITVTTPTGGVNAFFLQLGASTTGAPITITLSDGEVISSANGSAIDSPTYFAIAISHDVTSFSVSTASGNVFLDEAYYGASTLAQDSGGSSGGSGGDTSPSSEAATILMIGGGLLALFGSRRTWVTRLAA